MAGVIQIEKVKEKIKEKVDSFFRVAKRKRTIEFGYEISKSSIKECHEYRISYVVCNNVYSEKVLSIYFYYYKNNNSKSKLKIEYDYSKVALEHELDSDLLKELEKFTYSYFKDLENKLANKEKATKVKEYKDIFKAVEVIYYLN